MQYYSDPAWANFVAVNFGSPPLNLMDDDWSDPAPLLLEAHLRLSWLYLIYLIAKCISFLQKKMNLPKFSSIITCGFEAQFVASPN